MKRDNTWDLHIKPKSGFFDINLVDLWHYRDLIWLFVKRDFKANYKQTILGPIWHFVQPILTTTAFVIVFTKVARISTDGIPPVLFYLSSLTCWGYFSACLNGTSNTFVANANIFGKVYFPRLIIPISVVLANLVKFAIQFSLLIVAIIWYAVFETAIDMSSGLMLIPLLLFIMAGIGLGAGIIISALTTKYRDFAVLLGFVVQLLMYASPVVYPLSTLKGIYREFVWYNPITHVIEAFRYALFTTGEVSFAGLAYSFSFMVVVLFIGIAMFSKVERTFMDTV